MLISVAVVFAATVPLLVAAVCPVGFHAYRGGPNKTRGTCYFVSNERHNFADCQQKICGPLNSTLVTVTQRSEQVFLLDFLVLHTIPFIQMPSAFVGLYKLGKGNSMQWMWVDGSEYVPFSQCWSQGEPNNFCVEENCAMLSWKRHSYQSGWADVSCGAHQRCLCQAGGNKPSAEFESHGLNTTNVERPDYSTCLKIIGPAGLVGCFWYRDVVLQTTFIILALPCALAMAYMVASSLLQALGLRTGVGKFSLDLSNGELALYNQLLDVPVGGSDYKRIFRWCISGAVGELVYAAALLALAITVGYHIQTGFRFSFVVDAVEALIMFTSKMASAISILKVQYHLSPFARAVAGPWVTVLAVSKLLMALCGMALAGINFYSFNDVELETRGQVGSKDCNEGYIFVCALLAFLVLQSIAGLAIVQIQERAMGYADDSRVFSRVVGVHWAIMKFSTFGVGLGLGICSGMFIFDDPNDNVNPFYGIGVSFFAAGLCQLIGGNSAWLVVIQLKGHFSKPEPLQARVVDALELTQQNG